MKLYLWLNYRGAIINTEILSMSFDRDRAARSLDLSRASASTSIHDITIGMTSSCPHLPTLMSAFTSGDQIADVFLTWVDKDGRGRTFAQRKFRLQEVIISRLDFGVESEKVALGLNFEKIEQTYREGSGQ
jgi:type VI protein secretion system component Hcp